jgi:intracellular sulfur oxidation DsrE/DsrF family protein
MKKVLFFLFTLLYVQISIAQNNIPSGKVHRIVFQLMSDDSTVHLSLMKQLNNVLAAAPDTKLEVVCHGPGISLLMKEKTTMLKKIQDMKTKNVLFLACENTLKDKNIPKEKIIPEAGFVQSGIIEIVTRQEEGWSYIKSGF